MWFLYFRLMRHPASQPSTKDTVPSWELTYPLPMALLKMIFLFSRWDMLVPWRVYYIYIYIFIYNHLYALFLFIITSCRQIGLHHGVGLQLKFRQETTTLKLCLRFLRTPTRKIVSSTTTQFQKEFPRIQQRWPFKETDAQCNHCHFASQDKQKTIWCQLQGHVF